MVVKSAIYWAEAEFKNHFKGADPLAGADLNNDGRIDDSERPDSDGNGIVDAHEWKKYLEKNKGSLRKLGGFFDTYYLSN
jgi:hypothetical protein